jgi:hypothetical protein
VATREVGRLVKLGQNDATTAIILLTRGGACSGELDGGGRSVKVMFIKLGLRVAIQVVVSLSQCLVASDSGRAG